MLIKRVVFTETGTYNDLFNRPWTPYVKQDTLHKVAESTQGGANLTVTALAGVGSEILRPGTQVESAIGIANGFGERRLRFMMEVEYPLPNGDRQVDIVSGFTNYVGVIPSTHTMDPNMLLYINSITAVSSFWRLDANGMRRQDIHIREATQVMSSIYNPQSAINQYYLAPQDIFDGISLNHTLGGMADQRDIRVVDSRQVSLGEPRLSLRGNNHASNYLSRVLNAYQSAFATASTQNSNIGSVLNAAKSSVKDRSVWDNRTMATLMKQTNLVVNQGVQWGELLALNPNLESVTTVTFNRGAVERMPLPTRGDSEYWDSTTNETIAAQIVVNTVPTIMADTKLTKVAFTATNDITFSQNGTPYSVTIDDVAAFAKILEMEPTFMQQTINAFQHRIITELMPAITYHNQLRATVSVMLDVMGDTWIGVSLNGGPIVPYKNPQWCDALSAPIVTIDPNRRTGLARDMNALMENITALN